jgi:hypothetical protein
MKVTLISSRRLMVDANFVRGLAITTGQTMTAKLSTSCASTMRLGQVSFGKLGRMGMPTRLHNPPSRPPTVILPPTHCHGDPGSLSESG